MPFLPPNSVKALKAKDFYRNSVTVLGNLRYRLIAAQNLSLTDRVGDSVMVKIPLK